MTGVMGFFILYMFIFAISSLIMSLFTQDIATACSAVISSMSNVGPGFGEIGPMDNFANLHDFAKIFLSILMMVGRLEIFTVLVLFSKTFWKKVIPTPQDNLDLTQREVFSELRFRDTSSFPFLMF